MTHLLDTDHISILLYPTSRPHATIMGHVYRHAPADLAVPIVSFHEQTRGANAAVNGARTQRDVIDAFALCELLRAFYSAWTVLPFDDPAAVIFDQLKAQKVRIGTMDLRIAAIALSRNLTVVTRNVRDFGQVPGLPTEDWTT